MDTAASPIFESILAAAASGGEITIPPGVHAGCIEIPEGSRGLKLVGAGRNRTFLRSNRPGVPALRTSGLWYSEIRGICFETETAQEVVVDIDGSPRLGVQGNTFADCTFDGRATRDGQMSDCCLAVCRTGSSGGQGSEQCFLNCHFIGAKKACYYHCGYNALNNQFFGGNFQQYERCGAEVVFGSAHFYGVGFQSTSGYRQIKNDGWDIKVDSGGVGDSIVVSGCRTESLRFIRGCGAQPPSIIGCNQRPAVANWWPGMPVQSGEFVMLVSRDAKAELYRSRLQHADTDWMPSSWDRVKFNCVELESGVVINSNFQCGDVQLIHDQLSPSTQIVSDYRVPVRGVDSILADATRQSIVIEMPNEGEVPHGKVVEIFRGDRNGRNRVTVTGMYFNNDNVFAIELDTKTRRSVRLRAMGGGTITRRWMVM